MVEQHSEATPRLLGVTGPIACGKTTVGTMLLELGALGRIDADEVVHELMEPGTTTTRQIEAAFGSQAIAASGAVDRIALGTRVFADPAALRLLEGIVHPALRPAIRARIERFAGRRGVLILDAVKLLQSDLVDLCAAVWVVRCTPEQERRRLTEGRSLSAPEAEKRIAAQPQFAGEKVKAVIDNSGLLQETRSEVARLWAAFTAGEFQ